MADNGHGVPLGILALAPSTKSRPNVFAQEPPAMAERRSIGNGVRLKRVEITDFKGIDHVQLDFLPPRMNGDPDIHVMGSRNGLGKTSILEACVFLFLSLNIPITKKSNTENGFVKITINPPESFIRLVPDLFVRSGRKGAAIDGIFDFYKDEFSVRVRLSRTGRVSIEIQKELHDSLTEKKHRSDIEQPFERWKQFFTLLSGYDMDPIIMNSCLYFHSYRKIQEGNPEFGMMVEPKLLSRPMGGVPSHEINMVFERFSIVSRFKIEILRAMMRKANLFEQLAGDNTDETLEKLNGLIERYAAGRIEKLRPLSDNRVDFRITPIKGGASFAFDGLSSGQKEIVATLFLIWHYTRNRPGIILIDEPELHLNSEWHRDFVRHVTQLVPQNQYILATHSEDIFKSVDRDRRIFLGIAEAVPPSVGTAGENVR
ncbi:MAG: AAA family ATPase [Magnetococcales bacterium]|nr:AAA family ATPase [Magnetococcales bacterium]